MDFLCVQFQFTTKQKNQFYSLFVKGWFGDYYGLIFCYCSFNLKEMFNDAIDYLTNKKSIWNLKEKRLLSFVQDSKLEKEIKQLN